jgi:hypothetical protein
MIYKVESQTDQHIFQLLMLKKSSLAALLNHYILKLKLLYNCE